MRVLVTGAYGLIGSAVLARLYRAGHVLVAAGRSIRGAERRYPYARWVAADYSCLTRPEDWIPLLADVEAVVNCVGVLQDGLGDRTNRVHVATTCALFEACLKLGIRRVIHVSAIGASDVGATKFSRTKAAADMYLTRLDLDWVILRPALALGSSVYGGSAMLRGLAGLPLITPVIGADSRIQVVSTDDIAETVTFCLRPRTPYKVIWELAHPKVLSLGEILLATRAWLGFPLRRLVHVPRVLARLVSLCADALGWLGWRSPARSTAMAQLASGLVGDPTTWISDTGIKPKSFEDILSGRSAGVQDRWHARVYWLKPLAIAALALVWIVPGILRLIAAGQAGFDTIMTSGLAGATYLTQATLMLILGIGLLVRFTAPAALLGMMMLSMIQGIAAAPFAAGPLIWAIDVIVAISVTVLAPLFVLAILDDR